MSNNLRLRLVKGIGANAFGQIVTVIIQLVSVPLFLQAWGVELYGEWLTLSTIPSIFSMSDIGFASVAANEMTMEVAKGNRKNALDIFQSTWLFISSVSFAIILSVLAVIWFIPIQNWLNINKLSRYEVIGIVITLTLHVLIGLQTSLLQAGFRCEGNYARGTLLGSITRLSEYTILSVIAYLGAVPLVAAAFFLAARLIGTIFIWLELRKRSPWINYGWKAASLTTVKRLSRPAIAFMGLPLGHAFNNQGILTVVAITLGSKAVVIFSTLRTLSRLALQVMNIMNNAVWPELSVAFGIGDLDTARKLHRRSCQISVWLSFVFVVFLLLTGSWIIKVWTHGKINVDMKLFIIMLSTIVGNSFWSTSSCVLMATNHHQGLALRFMLSTGFSVILASYLTPIFGLNGTATSVLFTEVVMSMYVMNASLNLLNDYFSSFLNSLFVFPKMKNR
jgi:O-antigen/teichoic acid export membrane protein